MQIGPHQLLSFVPLQSPGSGNRRRNAGARPCVPLLVILGAIAGIASIISHGMTFYLIGRGVWALIIGISTRLPKKTPCPTYR
jgi:hypothetical protein